jgi:hypothetical protein
MEMKGKYALYALAVVVLMGSMAVAALADDHGMDSYGPADSSFSAQPEQGVEQPATGEIREPVETGALPDGSVKAENNEGWVNMDVSEQNRSPELWGRPNIQGGGGGE